MALFPFPVFPNRTTVTGSPEGSFLKKSMIKKEHEKDRNDLGPSLGQTPNLGEVLNMNHEELAKIKVHVSREKQTDTFRDKEHHIYC